MAGSVASVEWRTCPDVRDCPAAVWGAAPAVVCSASAGPTRRTITVSEADAREEADRVATGQGFTEHLAERMGAAARASAVFGEAVEGQGITVIPVARAKWGFGGGSGGRDGEQGAGGGGGTSVSPAGYIELRAGEARFRRIHNRAQIAAAAVACGLSAAVAFRVGRMRRPKAGRAGRAGVKWLLLKPAGMGFRLLRRGASS
jgi:Sporulation protein YtfJ (Spore_YtfJ)